MNKEQSQEHIPMHFSECKNCGATLTENQKYCSECGAKVVTERITFRSLFHILIQNVFGWDNRYFFTIRNLIVRPQVVLNDYLSGTRKKYVNPFTFFAIGVGILLIIFQFLLAAVFRNGGHSIVEKQNEDAHWSEYS